MVNFEIKDDEQLVSILEFKDDLIHVYDEMRFAKKIDYKAFKKLDKRLQFLNAAIESYIERSDSCFQIKCLERAVVEPQDTCELKTNVLGFFLQDTDIIFDGTIPSAGFLELSSENKDWGTAIYVKNKVPRKALDNWHSGYNYNIPTTTRYFDSGVYLIEKSTALGVGLSKDKELVKELKKRDIDYIMRGN